MLKYICLQTVYHLLFTGAVYLVLQAPCLGLHKFYVWNLTALISAAAFYLDLNWYRPIPKSPVQQFVLNFYIAGYGLLLAFLFGQMGDFLISGSLPATTFFFPVYYYFLLGLVTRIDYADMEDLHGRQYSLWERELIEAFRKAQE